MSSEIFTNAKIDDVYGNRITRIALKPRRTDMAENTTEQDKAWDRYVDDYIIAQVEDNDPESYYTVAYVNMTCKPGPLTRIRMIDCKPGIVID